MQFQLLSRHMGEILVVAPQIFKDERGFFMETYRSDQFKAFGLTASFVQDNHSRSVRNVVRGLHFQWDPPMGKLMHVSRGSAFLVAVDIRKGSPTLGKWFGLEVSEENRKQVWAPYGFARGFCALTDDCEVQYKCTAFHNSEGEAGVFYADPAIGIEWPLSNLIASARDRAAQTLALWLASPLSDKIVYEASKVAKETI